MDYNSLPLFGLMKAKLNYSSERAGVLAQNIANADTPGYRARDVKEPNFGDILSRHEWLQMAKTSAKHMNPSSNGAGMNVYMRESTYELSPVQNNVVIEEEMQRVAQNQAEYQKTLNLYRKTIAMFKIALGSPNSNG